MNPEIIPPSRSAKCRPSLTKCGFGTPCCCAYLTFMGINNCFACAKGTTLQAEIERNIKKQREMGMTVRAYNNCPGQGAHLN